MSTNQYPPPPHNDDNGFRFNEPHCSSSSGPDLAGRVVECFDQAMVRGLPAGSTVSGLCRKFGLRRDRVVEILQVNRRLRTVAAHDDIICLPMAPADAAARNVEREAEISFLQAGIEYAIAHRLIDASDLVDAVSTTSCSTDELLKIVVDAVSGSTKRRRGDSSSSSSSSAA